MYDQGKIWDLTPEGGGPPVQVVIGNPNEAIAAHPERYTRVPPDGTAAAAKAQRDAAQAEARAAIAKEEREALAKIAKDRQDKLDALAKEQGAARTKALEVQREEQKAELAKTGAVPSVDNHVAAIEAEAAAAAEVVAHEAEEKRRAIESQPAPAAPVAPAPAAPAAEPDEADTHHRRKR